MLTPETPQSAPIVDKVAAALNVTTISTEADIAEVFHYSNWEMPDGLLLLAGIFDFYTDENGQDYLVTVSNLRYSKKEHTEIYDAFLSKYHRVSRLWENTHTLESKEKVRFSKRAFISWGKRHKKLVEIPWLEDAEKQGYFPKDVDAKVQSDLKPRQHNSFHRIIYALTETLMGLKSEKDNKNFFPTEASVIEHLTQNYSDYEGVSATTLQKIFATAKKVAID